MNKIYLVGLFNGLLFPLSLLAGVYLDKGQMLITIFMVFICMIIEFTSTVLWFRTNKEIHVN